MLEYMARLGYTHRLDCLECRALRRARRRLWGHRALSAHWVLMVTATLSWRYQVVRLWETPAEELRGHGTPSTSRARWANTYRDSRGTAA